MPSMHLTLRLLLASLLAGASAGLVVLLAVLLDIPLAEGGSPFGVITLAAVSGAAIGGPYALLCGGLLRLLARRRHWQVRTTTAVFAVSGLAAGMLFAALPFAFDGDEVTPSFLLWGGAAGLAAAATYRFTMPPLTRRPLQEP